MYIYIYIYMVSPSIGNQLETQFMFTSSGWADDDMPLKYCFLWGSSKDASSLAAKMCKTEPSEVSYHLF